MRVGNRVTSPGEALSKPGLLSEGPGAEVIREGGTDEAARMRIPDLFRAEARTQSGPFGHSSHPSPLSGRNIQRHSGIPRQQPHQIGPRKPLGKGSTLTRSTSRWQVGRKKM